MKLPSFLSNKTPAQSGDALLIFFGRGYRPAIAILSDKRKTLVRFSDGKQDFYSNNRVKVITDERMKHQILREFK